MVFLFTKKLTTCFCFHFWWYFKVSLFILEEKWQAVADTHIVSEQTDNKVYNWVIKSHKKGNIVNCQLPINGMGDTWSLVSRWFDKSPSMLLLFQFMLIAACTYLSFMERLAKQIEVYQFFELMHEKLQNQMRQKYVQRAIASCQVGQSSCSTWAWLAQNSRIKELWGQLSLMTVASNLSLSIKMSQPLTKSYI